jgi:hypothetical protein
VAYIGTSKQIWIYWTYPPWDPLIHMLSKWRKTLSRGISRSLGMKIHNNRRMEMVALTHRIIDKSRKFNLNKRMVI